MECLSSWHVERFHNMAVLAVTALAHATDMKVETVLVVEPNLCQRQFRCGILVG